MDDRSWMYRKNMPGGKGITEEFINGVNGFAKWVVAKSSYTGFKKIKCPYAKCKNKKYQDIETMKVHLYSKSFVPNYFNWICHCEQFIPTDHFPLVREPNRLVETNSFCEVVNDVASSSFEPGNVNLEEPPNPMAKIFYDMLKVLDTPFVGRM